MRATPPVGPTPYKVQHQPCGTNLGLLRGHPAHVLGVQLHRVVAQLGFGSRLEVVAAHRKVTVPLHPPGKERRTKARNP